MTAAGEAKRGARESPDRLYVIARGRRPRGNFDLFTMVAARNVGPPPVGLQAEQQRILRLCQEPQTVLELSGELGGLPLGVANALLVELLDAGHITVHDPPARADQLDDELLKAVWHGLKNLR